jgi:TonB-linked SusC/RagA family outer membrane protein
MYKFYYTNRYGVTSYIRKSIASLWQMTWNPSIRKWLMRVNLTCLIILIAFMQVSLAASAQKISLSKKNAPITEVFRELKKQSGYGFMINREQIKLARPVTISATGDDLEKVLDKLFERQPFTYKLEGRLIVVIDRKPEQVKINIPPIDVKGRLVDENGMALVGASVIIKGTERKTVTSDNGEFSFLGVDEKAILVISFIGYETKEVSANANLTNLRMLLSMAKLDEVSIVSTGYQNIPKERATGSFSQPIKEVFESRVSTDVLSKLKGITSGLLFNSNTTRANGGQSDMNIRGRSTIFANDQPLIVLDNFPFTGDILNINPNEIENITILKDAAAASIWGVKAGNGVIVINTKQGKFEQPLKISYNINLTLSEKPNLNYNTNQLDPQNYIDLERYLFNKGYYDSFLADIVNYPVISPVVDLLGRNRSGSLTSQQLEFELAKFYDKSVNSEIKSKFYTNAPLQQYSINFIGGSKSIKYSFSGGYDKNIGTLKENEYERLTLNSQNTYAPFKNAEVHVGINLIRTKTKRDNTLNSITSSLFPYDSFSDENGNFLPISYGYNRNYLQSAQGNGFLDWRLYPLKELGLQENNIYDLNFRGNLGLKYTILNGLSAEIKYLYQNFNSKTRVFQSQETYSARNLINRYSIVDNGKVIGYNVPLGGILGLNDSKSETENLRAQINYNKKIGQHDFTAIAGYELSETITNGYSSSYVGYNDDIATFATLNHTLTYKLNPSGNGSIGNGLGVVGTINRMRSSFVNVAYTLKDKYTISGSGRVDGSNYFGVSINQKSVPLWSVGTSWQIDKEKFYNLAWLPKLRFRTTFGYNGNLDASVTGITTFRYVSNAQYTNLPYAITSNIGNPDLRWEKSAITNIGVDFAAPKGFVSGSIEFFKKKGTDIIGFKNFPTSSGITTLKGNYADMKAHGVDLMLNTQNIKSSFSWSTTFQLSYAKDKVTRYDVTPTPSQIVSSDGNSSVATPLVASPVFGIYSYKWAGLNPINGNPIGYFGGKESEDYASITSRTPLTELEYSGAARPLFFGGFSNQFSYYGFSLNVQIVFKAAYYFRKPTINYSLITSSSNANLNVNRDYLTRWQNSGDEAITNVPSFTYPSSPNRDNFYQYSEINVLKGDHIRLQDISLSYTLTNKAYPKLPFQQIQLFTYVNNVGILWKANKQGFDPDAVPSTFDRNTTIQPRTISFGIKGNL